MFAAAKIEILPKAFSKKAIFFFQRAWAFDGSVNLSTVIKESFAATGIAGDIGDYIDFSKLSPFNSVDRSTSEQLLRDFYDPKDAPYALNFALMSKHALSRIYERFVSILLDEEPDDQLTFIPKARAEIQPTKTGSVYTPQFIASFFAKYIRENTTPKQFRELVTLDPACGSGIFLRTILEEQCNPLDSAISTNTISEMFGRTTGIDKDGNALEATKLSLALLHLVSTDRLPPNLNLREADSILLAEADQLPVGIYDAVLTNPPYIKLDHLPTDTRATYRAYLGPDFQGRLDAYIPFMKLCLSRLSPGGFACFVIPQTFLQAKNAQMIRRQIRDDFDVRCLIDLSAIDVFEGVGAYSLLLVVQRAYPSASFRPGAHVAQATEFVGAALQAVLDGKEVNTPYFRVFDVGQDYFSSSEWMIRPPEVVEFDHRLRSYPRLSDYLDVFQGFVTGADDIFIRRKADIPAEERRIYMDYLPDRKIGRYLVPTSSEQMVFYPYLGERLIEQQELEDLFPEAWTHLIANRAGLEARRRSSSTPWWKPERPRDPSRMKRPKIVCPHLMLTPRFAIDQRGRFATKHGPVMVAKVEGEESLFLKFFCGVLNSSMGAWYIRTHVPTFSRGYSRLEPATLKNMPVPAVEEVSGAEIREVADLVDKAPTSRSAERRIDEIVQKLFSLRREEAALVGIQPE
ncbi:Eco57I restriction-modification methylase domain-containing protein [Sphingosinicella sp.]|uniref:Eco57I restriction-modification methylase domain-containing protein n=1 Tax=Sphingosinicella sp. TaxID=1917971 RepID=UPI0040384F04